MSCTNPMLMLVAEVKNANLQLINSLRKANWKVNYKENKAYRLVSQESRSWFLEMLPDYISHKLIEVPCGGCISCRLNYSRDWAIRCTLEALQYDCNYFLTLTYDDDHIHYGKTGNATIYKPDLDKFIHDLREKLRYHCKIEKFKYFYCQEYGDSSMRPHAHLILFNCPLPDLIDYFPQEDGSIVRQKNNMTGDFYFYSQFIKDIWPNGNILLAPCCWDTNAYVSRYILKKQKGKNSKVYSRDLCVEPPYIRMSQGIGANYLKSHFDDLIDNPYLVMPRDHKKPLVSMIPRAYKKKIFLERPDVKEAWHNKIIESVDKNRSLLAGNQLINDNRRIQEDTIVARSKAFNRDVD